MGWWRAAKAWSPGSQGGGSDPRSRGIDSALQSLHRVINSIGSDQAVSSREPVGSSLSSDPSETIWVYTCTMLSVRVHQREPNNRFDLSNWFVSGNVMQVGLIDTNRMMGWNWLIGRLIDWLDLIDCLTLVNWQVESISSYFINRIKLTCTE